MTDERAHDVAAVIDAIVEWASGQSDVRALALSGSWAHGRARMDSDLDLILLCTEPERYTRDGSWLYTSIPDAVLMDGRTWGALTDLRFILRSRLEIDIGVAPLSWAALDPIDETAAAVIADGVTILLDPDRLLANLVESRR